MKAKEWTFERPENLPEGPWITEPDKAQWMRRNGLTLLSAAGR
jgi:hypothetical protein